KEYHVDVDPYRLRGQGVSLGQVTAALPNANQNVGGQRVTLGEQSYDVRGLGSASSAMTMSPMWFKASYSCATAERPARRLRGSINASKRSEKITCCPRAWKSSPTTTGASLYGSRHTRSWRTFSSACCWYRSCSSSSWAIHGVRSL